MHDNARVISLCREETEKFTGGFDTEIFELHKVQDTAAGDTGDVDTKLRPRNDRLAPELRDEGVETVTWQPHFYHGWNATLHIPFSIFLC